MERTPQERAIDLLTHDHANAMALISSSRRIVEREIRGGDSKEALKWLDNITNHIKKANDALDHYYTQFKNDFK